MSIGNAIENFKQAQQHLQRKEDNLNQYVQKAMKKATTIAELQDLADILPLGYKGLRRIYEQIIRMEDAEKKTN
jgi:predicted nucleotidyltransferase